MKPIFLKNTFRYIIFFLPTCIIFAVIWYFLIDGVFYYCSDKVPIFDMLPPFVHGAIYGDYFIQSPVIVYVFWVLFILAIMGIPVWLSRLSLKKRSTVLFSAAIIVSIPIWFGIILFGILYTIESFKDNAITVYPQHEVQHYVMQAKPRPVTVEYQVMKGDTLRTIADRFSISVDTIKWANSSTDDVITQGLILRILPVTGVEHLVVKGDTVQSIAIEYKTDPQKIVDYPYNEFADNLHSLIPGSTIIVPDGVKPLSLVILK